MYADEDRLDARGERGAPLFKPPWDADWFAEQDLIGGAALFRRSLLRDGDETDLWRTALRIAGQGGRIGNMPSVLFHSLPDAPPRRMAPPVACGMPASPPLVSVIVPTRDRAALLAACAAGVLTRTDYPALEFLVVDNASRQPRTARLLNRLRQDPPRAHPVLSGHLQLVGDEQPCRGTGAR